MFLKTAFLNEMLATKQNIGIVSYQCAFSCVNSTFAHTSHTQHTAGVVKAQ
jgi:hypothetical protein